MQQLNKDGDIIEFLKMSGHRNNVYIQNIIGTKILFSFILILYINQYNFFDFA